MAQNQAAGTRRPLTAQSLSVAAVAAVCLLAWIMLLVGQGAPYGHRSGQRGLDVATATLGLMAGWLLMVIAMMLPSALPFLLSFQRESRGRPDLAWLSTLLVVGYLLSWALFGIVLFGGDWLLRQLPHPGAELGASAKLPGALALLVAGAYQLTPHKRRSLEACGARRGCPSGLAGRSAGGARQALLAGLDHGRCCIGCCWALMLLMFAAGAHSLAWMAALGVVMAAERWPPWGRRLVAPLGGALLLWGALTLLGGAAVTAPLHHH